jgi:hypothetical protein
LSFVIQQRRYRTDQNPAGTDPNNWNPRREKIAGMVQGIVEKSICLLHAPSSTMQRRI